MPKKFNTGEFDHSFLIMLFILNYLLGINKII